MSFFLPGKLVEFEYFETKEPDIDYMKMAEPYEFDLGFAFFAANFNYSLSDYNDLTGTQRALIMKEFELKQVKENKMLNQAVINAIYNANRGKNKSFKELWKKVVKKDESKVKELKNSMKEILKIEEENGKDWVQKIYSANFLNMKKGG